MRYIVTFFWSFILMQMVNFLLNSLNGGGPLNVYSGVLLAVLIAFTVFILDGIMKNEDETSEEH
jgi:hypothetical protein